MKYYSPFRYPGGKGKLSTFFKTIYKDNLLYDGIYVEPYAGGASVALSLLYNAYASKIIINDLDYSIFSFWYSTLNYTEELCKKIFDTKVNVENWYKQKEIQKNASDYDQLDVGFSTFFLNRTNRSGILNAWMIGGINQTGNWKIDARFNKKDLIQRIETIALYKNKIDLFNMDAVRLIKNLKNKLPKKTLIYFDPPYYMKGKDLYLNAFKDQDHLNVSNTINELGNLHWVVTYDNVPFIKNLYNTYRQFEYSLQYSAHSAREAKEVLIASDNIVLPENTTTAQKHTSINLTPTNSAARTHSIYKPKKVIIKIKR